MKFGGRSFRSATFKMSLQPALQKRDKTWADEALEVQKWLRHTTSSTARGGGGSFRIGNL